MNLRRLSSKSVLYILLFYTAVLLNQIYVRSQFPFSSGIIRDLVCPNFSLVSGLDSYTLHAASVSYSLQVKFPIFSRFSFLFSPGLVSFSLLVLFSKGPVSYFLQVQIPILSRFSFLFSPVLVCYFLLVLFYYSLEVQFPILCSFSFLFSAVLVSYFLQVQLPILSRFSFLFYSGSVSYSLQVQFPIISRFCFLFSPGSIFPRSSFLSLKIVRFGCD